MKICLITLTIQLVGIVPLYIHSNYARGSNILDRVATISVVVGIIVAIVVDIILTIRWAKTIVQKLIYIFLMPTNYLWLAFLLWTIWYCKRWWDMLGNIYK